MYNTHDYYISKVKLRGQNVVNITLSGPTSQVIVVSSRYLVEMFTMICRHVAYNTHDSYVKGKNFVNFTSSGQ